MASTEEVVHCELLHTILNCTLARLQKDCIFCQVGCVYYSLAGLMRERTVSHNQMLLRHQFFLLQKENKKIIEPFFPSILYLLCYCLSNVAVLCLHVFFFHLLGITYLTAK